MPVIPLVKGMRPRDGFETLRQAGLVPVLLGVPTLKSDGNFGYLVAVQEPAAGQEVADGERVYLAFGTRLLSFGTIDGPEVAPAGTPAPDAVGIELEQAMSEITRHGLVAVVVQPERAVTSLEVSRQEPQPGEPTSFREVVLHLD